MSGEGDARAGRRSNGLVAGAYLLLTDCEPPVADALLPALAEAGIAAYVEPHAGTVGGYLEVRLPDRPTGRVWVDAGRLGEAQAILRAERAEADVDAGVGGDERAWQEIVAALRRDEDGGTRRWPSARGEGSAPAAAAPLGPAAPEAMPVERALPEPDEHFDPPPPPPLPRIRGASAYAVAAIVGGILVLVVPTVAGDPVGPGLSVLAIIAILGGFLTLVARMREGPPTDSGPDDGAVV